MVGCQIVEWTLSQEEAAALILAYTYYTFTIDENNVMHPVTDHLKPYTCSQWDEDFLNA